MSTKLKLLGVDVASFGDAMGGRPDCLEVAGQRRGQPDLRQAGALRRRQDPARRHSGRRRVGLRGAASRWSASSCPATRSRSSRRPDPTGGSATGGRRAARRRADLFVQQRHQGRSQGCDRRRLRGRARLEELHQGGHVVRLLRAAAQTAARGRGRRAVARRCASTSASRAPNCSRSSRATEIRTFSGLIERFGTGKGCDICKPVVASILASTSSDHILDGEQAVAAGLQRPLPGQHPDATAATRWCRGCPAATSPPSN